MTFIQRKLRIRFVLLNTGEVKDGTDGKLVFIPADSSKKAQWCVVGGYKQKRFHEEMLHWRVSIKLDHRYGGQLSFIEFCGTFLPLTIRSINLHFDF